MANGPGVCSRARENFAPLPGVPRPPHAQRGQGRRAIGVRITRTMAGEHASARRPSGEGEHQGAHLDLERAATERRKVGFVEEEGRGLGLQQSSAEPGEVGGGGGGDDGTLGPTWSVGGGARVRSDSTLEAAAMLPSFQVIPEMKTGGGGECLHCAGAKGLAARKLCTKCMSAWFCSAECLAEGQEDHHAGCEAVQGWNKALEAIIARADEMELPDLPAHLLPAITSANVHLTQSPRPSRCGLCGVAEKVSPVTLACGHAFCGECLDLYQWDRLFRGAESSSCPLGRRCEPRDKEFGAGEKMRAPGPEVWHAEAEELLRMAHPPVLAESRREALLAKAEALWCKVIEADPILTDPTWTPRAYLGLAAVARARGDRGTEGALLGQVTQLVPGDPLAASNVAMFMQRPGECDVHKVARVLEEAERECQPRPPRGIPNERVMGGIGVSCMTSLNVAPVFHIACASTLLLKAASWEDEQLRNEGFKDAAEVEEEERKMQEWYEDITGHLLGALEHGRGSRAVERFVVPVLFNLAVEMEDWEEALKWLHMSEVDHGILSQLSCVSMELEQYEAAERYALTAIRLRHDASAPFVLLAKSLVGLGDLDGAIESMRAALAIDQLDTEYLMYLVVLLRTKKLDEMREYRARLHSQRRKSISTSLEAVQSEEQAQALAFLERHAEREEELREETEPALRARIAGDPLYRECDFALKCALAVDPARAEVHRDVGALLYQIGGKAAGEVGLRSFKRALELADPDQHDKWQEELGIAAQDRQGFEVDEEERKPYWYGKGWRWMFASNGDGLEYAEIDETGQRKHTPALLALARRVGRKWARYVREKSIPSVGGVLNALAQARTAEAPAEAAAANKTV